MSRLQQAELLMRLFPGLPGTLLISEPTRDRSKGTKVEPNYRLDNATLTPTRLLDHLEGRQRIGVCPIAADGRKAGWGVLDIDLYDYPTYNQLAKVLHEHWPPGLMNYIVPHKTKSGGWHLFIIFDELVDASFIRELLYALACWLPFPQEKMDRRPNQSSLLLESGDKGSRGTYVNLPLFGANEDEAALFLREAQDAIVSEANMRKLVNEGDFEDGPPCLFPLHTKAERGELYGSRNFLFYQLLVFWKKKYPNAWEEKAKQYNKLLGLDENEVSKSIRYRETSEASYVCSNGPFPGVCNKEACLKRSYGIRSTGTLEVIRMDSLGKYTTEPPRWFLTVVGKDGEEKRMELSTDQLTDVRKFQKRCMEEGNVLPDMPKPKQWEKIVQELLEKVTEITVPPDATYSAQLQKRLYDFYASTSCGHNPDCLIRGMVFLHEGNALFRISDLRDYLQRKRENVPMDKLFVELQKLGELDMECGLKQVSYENLGVKMNVWSFQVPEHLQRRSIEQGEA